MQTQGVAATGQSYIVYNTEIQSWLTGSFCICIHFKYRDTYRIVTQVSRYVSYREGTVSLRP